MKTDDLPVKINAVLGTTTKTVAELQNLKEGDVITLDQEGGEPTQLVVNGKVVALCEVVLVNDNYGVRVVELV